MKINTRILSIVMVCSIISSSCGTLGGTFSESSTNAASIGSTIGSILLGFYLDKQSGSLDLSSGDTLLQLAKLVASTSTLKSSLNDPTFLTEAAAGLVKGTKQNVTENNAVVILDKLVRMDFGNVVQKVVSKDPPIDIEASEIKSSLLSVLGLIGK